MTKEKREEILAGELREMVSFGWTDEEAKENKEAFFDRIGEYGEDLKEDEIWTVWAYVLEEQNDLTED